MTHFLQTFHRIALWVITYNERNLESDIDTNVDIDVGSDVAIKMKYTHKRVILIS